MLGEQSYRPDERNINQTAGLIEKSLSEFGIPAKVVGFRIGPTVTQFAVQPGFIRKGTEEDAQQMKVRVAQIANLQKDLALALSAERLRIEAPVPGRAYVGIEVPKCQVCLGTAAPDIGNGCVLQSWLAAYRCVGQGCLRERRLWQTWHACRTC